MPVARRLVRAVLFDLDNTLLDRDAGFRRFCHELYRSSTIMRAAHTESEAVALMAGFDRGGLRSRPEMFSDLLALWPGVFRDTEHAVQEYMGSYPRMLTLAPQTQELLSDLSSSGVPYGIVTNGGSEMQWTKVRTSGLDALTRTVIVSEDVGVAKPDRGIFEVALSGIGASAETTLFVGDNPDADILGAAALGMLTAWIRLGREWPYEDQRPDYILDHVAEVRGIVLGRTE